MRSEPPHLRLLFALTLQTFCSESLSLSLSLSLSDEPSRKSRNASTSRQNCTRSTLPAAEQAHKQVTPQLWTPQVVAFWSQLIKRDATSPLFHLPLKLGGLGVGSAAQRHAAAPWRAWQSVIPTRSLLPLNHQTRTPSSLPRHCFAPSLCNYNPPFHDR